MNNCDGSVEAIVAATECFVTLADLVAAPFDLGLGAVIEVKLLAYNYYGDSAYSDVADS